ncbi:uncharacterized protein LOC135386025 [Ornithodoros turicata]|uniref:uncharacterized protein LOC135386025 n=1 Tax=Ornithodoros turicata TaxID=34597 RepID=UPI003139D33E
MDQKSWPPAWRTPDEPCVEVRNETKAQTACCVPILATTTLMDVVKYSSLHRLLRVTAWVSRFLHNCRHTTAERRGPLTAAEVVAAETYWVTAAQRQNFGSHPAVHKSLQNVSVFHDDDGVLRLTGRLHYSDFEETQKHPIVIPADHPFTALLVFRAHIRLLRAGVQETLAALREEYWVLRGRQAVKRILNGCRACRRAKVQACTEVTAPLPRDRLSQSSPFEVTGTDFAGPLYYKCSKGGGRKCYILIFTCAVTRAVHLELTKSMSTEDFLMALRRFVSRRGVPATIYSDNFRTFKRASRELTPAWLSQNAQVNVFLTARRITWKFIVERGAWWGGFWERLIRSTKNLPAYSPGPKRPPLRRTHYRSHRGGGGDEFSASDVSVRRSRRSFCRHAVTLSDWAKAQRASVSRTRSRNNIYGATVETTVDVSGRIDSSMLEEVG